MRIKLAATKAGRFDSLEQQVFLGLWRTYDRLRTLEEDFFADYHLTPQQYNALRLLDAAHPADLGTLDLARRLVSRAPDITRMLDRLEERRLIRRERPTDNRRAVRVAITASGRALVGELLKPLRQCHVRQLGHLSQTQLRKLVDLLREARLPHEQENSIWR